MAAEIVPLVTVKAAVGPGQDPAEVERAWRAAEAWVWNRIRPWWAPAGSPPTPAPADLVEAVILLVRRYLARKASPAGVLGTDEFGIARVAGNDPDVRALVGPYRPVVFG